MVRRGVPIAWQTIDSFDPSIKCRLLSNAVSIFGGSNELYEKKISTLFFHFQKSKMEKC